MNENNLTNVQAAFEILLEQIEVEIDLINKVGSRTFERRDYDSAREAIQRATQATELRDKMMSLRKEWETLTASRQDIQEESIRAERRHLGRLQRRLRTPEIAYYQPILRALSELGGSGKMNDVLERVEQTMQGTLTGVDYQPVASDPEMPRWRNTAQWARYSMVKEGLLKQDSPRGVWEITEAGHMALKEERP